MWRKKVIQQITDKIREAKGDDFAKKLMLYMFNHSQELTKSVVISFPESITLFIDTKILGKAVRFFQNSNSTTDKNYLYDYLRSLGKLFFNAEFDTFRPGYFGEPNMVYQGEGGYTFVLSTDGWTGERLLYEKIRLLRPNIVEILNTELK